MLLNLNNLTINKTLMLFFGWEHTTALCESTHTHIITDIYVLLKQTEPVLGVKYKPTINIKNRVISLSLMRLLTAWRSLRPVLNKAYFVYHLSGGTLNSVTIDVYSKDRDITVEDEAEGDDQVRNCDVAPRPFSCGEKRVLRCAVNVWGRYVWIKQPMPGMTLCEVEIYGESVTGTGARHAQTPGSLWYGFVHTKFLRANLQSEPCSHQRGFTPSRVHTNTGPSTLPIVTLSLNGWV